MEIDKMSIMELKAVAYDLIGQLERTTRDLQEVNRRIAEGAKPKEEPKA